MRSFLLGVLLSEPALLGAQVRDTVSASSPVNVWLSVSLGPGASGTDSPLIGGQLALWGSVDRIAFGIRRAGAANVDDRDNYDTALLAGMRSRAEDVTAVVAVGPSLIGGTRSGDRLGPDLGLSFAGELAWNLRWTGLGVGTFGGLGARTRFAGLGVTVEFGKIR